jgi:hypothetical protein
VQLSFDFYMIEAMPDVLIGDRAYDSDDLDENLREKGVKHGVAASQEPIQAADAGSPRATPVQAPMDRRAILRLDEAQTSAAQSLGASPGEFPRVCAGFRRYSAA